MPVFEILDDGSRREKIPPRKPEVAEFAKLRALNASLADTLECVEAWVERAVPVKQVRRESVLAMIRDALVTAGRRHT